MEYLFKSERLGFKNWDEESIEKMIAVSADPEVMRFFPSPASPEKTRTFGHKMKKQCDEIGYCYFATEILETREFIGFIGLSYQDYDTEFTPCTDIGWRLKKSAWNKGYATEGAKACLNYGFNKLGLKEIYSVASDINIPSINVMKKIGMEYKYNFDHPLLLEYPKIKVCVLYKISASER